MNDRVRINQGIKASELRVIGADGANLGIISPEEAFKVAQEAGLDLIEISPKAQPPVAKIMDYGKFQYEQKKKQREIKAKSHVTETKTVQVKIGTGDHDLDLKASRVETWLSESHRVKIDLFLWGRYKYMDRKFLQERLERFLARIPHEYKIADEIKKGPKGLTITIEKAPATAGQASATAGRAPSTTKQASATVEARPTTAGHDKKQSIATDKQESKDTQSAPATKAE